MYKLGTTHPRHWRCTPYHGLLKRQHAKNLKDMRWIAKISHTKQWFSRCWKDNITHTETTHPTSPHTTTYFDITPPSYHAHNPIRRNPRIYGFRAGHCPGDITAFLRGIFFYTHRWQHTQYVMGSFDIQIAFDAQKHDELHKALEQNNTPARTSMATAQDYTNKTATLHLTQTVKTNEISFTQGVWQGGTRTPDEFNTIIHNIYTNTITKWREEGIGYHIEGRDCNHIIWADNIILIANSFTEMQLMLDELSQHTHTQDATNMWKEEKIWQEVT